MAGRGQLRPADRAALIQRYHKMQAAQQERGTDLGRLTPREREVLARLTAGLNAATIAAESYTSIHTVRTHIRMILTKLHVNTQGAAIALAVRQGFQRPPFEPVLSLGSWRL
jgi:DNA-binding NarL/FixJ family response regulator